jgi:SAM-dependent methyltransferase
MRFFEKPDRKVGTMLTGLLHEKMIYGRRVEILARHLSEFTPDNSTVLDVGCGDGLLANLVEQRCPGVATRGIDIFVRPKTHIPVLEFDGERIPYPDKSHDVVRFVDVLHHTPNPVTLLAEAKRVARKHIIIKDHNRNGLFANQTLKLMDYAGNAHHGVVLPYNYWSRKQWAGAFAQLGLREEERIDNLGLYLQPLSLFFDRNLHFVVKLSVQE